MANIPMIQSHNKWTCDLLGCLILKWFTAIAIEITLQITYITYILVKKYVKITFESLNNYFTSDGLRARPPLVGEEIVIT